MSKSRAPLESLKGMPLDSVSAGAYVTVLRGRSVPVPVQRQPGPYGEPGGVDVEQREDESLNGHVFLVIGTSLPYVLLQRIYPIHAAVADGYNIKRLGPFNMAVPSFIAAAKTITVDLRHIVLIAADDNFVAAVLAITAAEHRANLVAAGIADDEDDLDTETDCDGRPSDCVNCPALGQCPYMREPGL